jgi:Flp pilus assembly pilin Flp
MERKKLGIAILLFAAIVLLLILFSSTLVKWVKEVWETLCCGGMGNIGDIQ